MAERSVQELYLKARKCSDEQHKTDPKSEPFKSFYEANGYLSDALNNFKNSSTKGEDADLSQAQLLYEMAILDAETEESGAGLKYLKNSLEILKSLPSEITPKRSILHLAVLNQLAILDSIKSQLEEALEKLKQAEELYNRIREKWPSDETLDKEGHHLKYLLGNKEIPYKMKYSIWLEEEGTKTGYYLAQCYQHLDDKNRAAMYCHNTLKKQLKNRAFLSFFEPIDWAINAATLSQFFLFRDEYRMALHLLACADYMMSQANPPKETLEHFKMRSADIARCWIKYCVYLLENSAVEFAQKTSSDKPSEEKVVQVFPTKMIDNEEICTIEGDVPWELFDDFENARKIFLVGQKKFNEAVSYYSLQDRASDNVLVVQDCSKLYNSLIVFETQLDRKCKMEKRRIDLLEAPIKVLNPKFYGTELQSLYYELGNACADMANFKSDYVQQTSKEKTQAELQKIFTKHLYFNKAAIKHYETFVAMTKDCVMKESLVYPESIPKYQETHAMAILKSLFLIAHLRLKIFTQNVEKDTSSVHDSLDIFKNLLSYLEKYPEHGEYLNNELPLIRSSVEEASQFVSQRAS